jgi:hypothetical protein
MVDNQFGSQTMSLSKPDRMMVPTAKSTTGAPVPLTDPIDHYKCYKVGAAKLNVPGVTITDQFGTITVDIKKPLHLCLPAIKEHEGPLVDPTTALMCYKVNGPPQADPPGGPHAEPVRARHVRLLRPARLLRALDGDDSVDVDTATTAAISLPGSSRTALASRRRTPRGIPLSRRSGRSARSKTYELPRQFAWQSRGASIGVLQAFPSVQ